MVDVLGGLTATSSLAFKILGWFPLLLKLACLFPLQVFTAGVFK